MIPYDAITTMLDREGHHVKMTRTENSVAAASDVFLGKGKSDACAARPFVSLMRFIILLGNLSTTVTEMPIDDAAANEVKEETKEEKKAGGA